MTASDTPKVVHLVYSCEDNSWAVESEQMPSLFAGGDSFEEAKALAHQAVHDELGDALTIFDWPPVPGELEPIISSRANQTVEAKPTASLLDMLEPIRLDTPQNAAA
jgi:hypothetical protein